MKDAATTWLALRAEWPRAVQSVVGGLRLPDTLVGVACTAFAIGTEAIVWLNGLAGSEWYAGLRPTPDDLRASAGSEAWPDGFIAMIAMSAQAEEAEAREALDLLARLAGRRVIVTLGGPASPSEALTVRLTERGAFVLRAAWDLAPGKVHHFPLRAATSPRRGRVIGIDLSDALAVWPAGRIGTMYAAPLAFRAIVHPLQDVLASYDHVETLFLDMHLDLSGDGWTLADIDALANRLVIWSRGLARDRFVFSSSECEDGAVGGLELVVVGTRDTPVW